LAAPDRPGPRGCTSAGCAVPCCTGCHWQVDGSMAPREGCALWCPEDGDSSKSKLFALTHCPLAPRFPLVPSSLASPPPPFLVAPSIAKIPWVKRASEHRVSRLRIPLDPKTHSTGNGLMCPADDEGIVLTRCRPCFFISTPAIGDDTPPLHNHGHTTHTRTHTHIQRESAPTPHRAAHRSLLVLVLSASPGPPSQICVLRRGVLFALPLRRPLEPRFPP
jgi:hypothetical protein